MSAHRLLDAAMPLFARQGFEATSIGEIETAAGFAPRSGAMYQYFASKQALLDAGLERHFASIVDVGEDIALRPLGEMRSELTLLARWLLAELDLERDMTHVIEREGERLGDVQARAREGMSERGYKIGSEILARWVVDMPQRERDALAVVSIGSIVNFRRSTWTFGRVPLGLTDDEFVASWVELSAGHIEALAELT